LFTLLYQDELEERVPAMMNNCPIRMAFMASAVVLGLAWASPAVHANPRAPEAAFSFANHHSLPGDDRASPPDDRHAPPPDDGHGSPPDDGHASPPSDGHGHPAHESSRIDIESVGTEHVLLAWEVPEESAGAVVWVSLRKRDGTGAHPWGPEIETAQTSAEIHGLESGTIYDVRIRHGSEVHSTEVEPEAGGTLHRVVLPIEGPAGFFRIR
jgi:hypothetical protein